MPVPSSVRSSVQWFETFFQGVAADFWSRAMTPEMTAADVDFIEALVARPNSRLLDVPCGNGRHAIELARRGHSVTGVDLSTYFLAQARESSAGLSVEFFRADMRDLCWSSEFEAAYCFGNSFGYLDAREAELFLGGMAAVLKPSGRLAIETGMAAESILVPLPTRRWYRVGDTFMLSEARYVPIDSRLDIDYTFIHGGEIETRSTSSYVLTLGEMRRMLERAGFEEIVAQGGLNGEAYKPGSPRLIISARKKE